MQEREHDVMIAHPHVKAGSNGLGRFSHYSLDGFFDETIDRDGHPRTASRPLIERLGRLSDQELLQRQRAAERALLHMGITFQVYSDTQGSEKIFPFDVIPRVIESAEWNRIERGLKQRITALNLFIDDIYHDQRILREGVIPREIIASAKSYRSACAGLNPPRGIWCHVTGTDLVRDRDGTLYVLEDNLRCPSGVSYVLENRRVMKSTFPTVFESTRIRPVSDYPSHLLDTLEHLAPDGQPNPRVVVLTPGVFNSAYFEHSFLAQQMGVDLVEGRDLVVFNGCVHMRTTHGYERVDVIYRRVDDDFPRPQGVPGRFDAGRAGSHGGLQGGPGRAGQRPRKRGGGRQGRVRLRAGHDPLLPGRGRHPAQRAHLPVLA
jgi:uncharacterized circularly permuted ATP-grasp superfamily protein